jgi:hypothetical protein
MILISPTRCRPSRVRRRTAAPSLERLEDRLVLSSVFGGRFTYGNPISYSFAPDGTSIGGTPSNMFQAMAEAGISQVQWQSAFQKAAAIWEAAANINLIQVGDDGEPFGASGPQQGSANYGDIRIGGVALSGGALAQTYLPPPYNGGSLAGDMVFNTSQTWHINSDYDLETVALHEIGHALSMGHSTVSTAVMYGNYTGMKQSLDPDDASGIQSVWGARPADTVGNGTWSTAFGLNPYINSLNQVSFTGPQLTGASDVDWYVIVAPVSGQMNVSVQSTYQSSLCPKVCLFNSSLVGVASSAAPNSFGATVTASYNVTAGQTYYIKASAANSGAGSAGAFAFQLNFGPTPMPLVGGNNTYVAQQPDQGTGSAYDVRNGKSTATIVGTSDTPTTDTFGPGAQHVRHAGRHHPRPVSTSHPHGPVGHHLVQQSAGMGGSTLSN